MRNNHDDFLKIIPMCFVGLAEKIKRRVVIGAPFDLDDLSVFQQAKNLIKSFLEFRDTEDVKGSKRLEAWDVSEDFHVVPFNAVGAYHIPRRKSRRIRMHKYIGILISSGVRNLSGL